MNAVYKKRMMREAEMQLKALKKINIWKLAAIAFSTIGVALTYAGIAGDAPRLFLSIPGIILIIVSLAAALLLNLGLKNGRRNVEKILCAIEGNMVENKDYEI